MRKLIIVLMALALVAGFTGVSMAAISGSEHDFSTKGWAQGEICLPCHTPHHADTSVGGAPLWNHTVTSATYTLYNSLTLDANDLGQPDGVSKLCLSCHDGTVAIDSFGGTTGSSFIGGSENLGTDMADDHPLSFTYDPALATADGGLFDPTTATTSLGGTIDNDLLFGAKVECSSCHDVHNQYGNNSLLKIANSGSDLCLTCHNK